MKTVSRQFVDEQLKLRSDGLYTEVMLTSGSDSIDLTPYLVKSALSRCEHRLESEMTEWRPSDIQFHIVYDDIVWEWLLAHEHIQVDVNVGFPFEKVRYFWGYIDKDSLEKDSMGIIYIRAYSFIEYLQTIKTTDVFGSVLDPPLNVPLKDVVQTIFDYLELSSQNIQVMPIDTYPDAESYALSYLGIEGVSANADNFICRITAYKFYYLTNGQLYLIEFNDDFTDFTVTLAATNISAPGLDNPIAIYKWEDDKYAIVTGHDYIYYYKNNGGWSPVWNTNVAESIIFFDGDGTYLSTTSLTTFVSGSYTYTPMGHSIRKLERQDYYMIIFNGAATSTPEYFDRSLIRIYNADTHAVVQTIELPDHYYHPQSRAASGHFTTKDYYVTFLCPNDDPTANVSVFRVKQINDVWVYDIIGTDASAATLGGNVDMLGPYLCFENKKRAYNVDTGVWDTAFFAYEGSNDLLGKAVRQSATDDPYQIISRYNSDTYDLEIKTITPRGAVATELIEDIMISSFLVKTGFTFWRTNEGVYCMIGMLNAYFDAFSIGLIANKIYPYVPRPPLSADENLADTIRDLATAGCCFYQFPDDDTGYFVSRLYLGDDTVYPISPPMYDKEWKVEYKEPRRVEVRSNTMTVECGEGLKSVTINSDYIPYHDEDIGRAYGYPYYQYLVDNDYLIEISTDMLLQYDLYDRVRITDRTGEESYQGRIIKVVQEGSRINFEVRGERL